MYAEDRVLVAYVPRPSDFTAVCQQHWYRIPVKHAPKGLHAEYIAFYFGKSFGDEKWAIRYYARNHGHELLRRCDLIPDEPNHPRAQEIYYKIQLSELKTLPRPIVSLRWRRILFIHTTWDRFQVATEINDLLIEGEGFADRKFSTLRENPTPPYAITE